MVVVAAAPDAAAAVSFLPLVHLLQRSGAGGVLPAAAAAALRFHNHRGRELSSGKEAIETPTDYTPPLAAALHDQRPHKYQHYGFC